jgi:NAD-dependent deacetylase
MISKAAQICSTADLFILVGSSLAVYPAAGLVNYVSPNVPKYIVDPNIPDVSNGFVRIEEKATTGVTFLVDQLME